MEDAAIGHFDEVSGTRKILDRRYDDLKSGAVQTVGGEAFFEALRQREDELLKTRAHK